MLEHIIATLINNPFIKDRKAKPIIACKRRKTFDKITETSQFPK